MGRLTDIAIGLSRAFDKLLPPEWSVEGSQYYRRTLLPSHLAGALKVWDLGSGRYPMVSPDRKAAEGMHVTGLDLSAEELELAPTGAYDVAVAADATTFVGQADADLVISHCCFEHLPNTEGGFRAVASILKPGGKAVIYMPSGNAVFARINLLLPEALKRRLLGTLPDRGGKGGWPACYDRCTPKQFTKLAEQAGLEVVELRTYWISGYFLPFPPVYVLWRFWMIAFRAVSGIEAAESFSMILRKPT
jgi:SAM-dependent methyltransferase